MAQQSAKKKSTPMQWALVGIAGFLFVCVACGVVAALVDDTDSEVASSSAAAPAPTDMPPPTEEPVAAAEEQAVAEDAPAPELTPVPEPTAAPEPTPVPEPTAPPEPTAAPTIGQDIVLEDSVRWRVMSFDELGNVLTDDNEYTEDLTTSGRYVRVVAETENLTSDAHYLSAPKIVDNQGRAFDHLNEALAYMLTPDAQQCALQEINPNIVKQCMWHYELPADAAGLSLQVDDYATFFGGGQAHIALQ